MPKPLAEHRKVRDHGTRSFAFVDLYRASPFDRIEVIKAGVSARMVKHFITQLHLEQHVMFEALNLKTATVNKKAARNEPLSAEDSERVVGLAKLVGQLEAMVEEAGDAEGFDAPEWLSRWLREPLPALGGGKPIDLLDTMEGQALVSRALSQIQSGAYA
ncbi:type II toxin-antitoxin system Prs ADP-ribosylating antitoxin ParS [Acidocella sp.]|uniref:type II toxin-antitoxin system Prs ADP-ribosylating antitoxin ParS n=1 Tax=Acidocella sp. TaxID=50710 RepID=UPI00260C8431|nr:antitoxin Xre/MbcA/ParS toxin-binding domain-containing protein [Acidocella sp.]